MSRISGRPVGRLSSGAWSGPSNGAFPPYPTAIRSVTTGARSGSGSAKDSSALSTRVWIDETYVDYVGSTESLEAYAAASTQVLVCKSMSKVYALSGVRAAYLVGPAALIDELRPLVPPWAVSLPAQIAACEVLCATHYYESKWRDTHTLRDELRRGLERLGWHVTPGCANFLLCHLPTSGPTAAELLEAARARDLFIRKAGPMGSDLGPRVVRIAVKDRATNARALAILTEIAQQP